MSLVRDSISRSDIAEQFLINRSASRARLRVADQNAVTILFIVEWLAKIISDPPSYYFSALAIESIFHSL